MPTFAATTALMAAYRNPKKNQEWPHFCVTGDHAIDVNSAWNVPAFSNASTPAMVVPPGLHTWYSSAMSQSTCTLMRITR